MRHLCGKKLATENNVSFFHKILLLLLYARECKTKYRHAISFFLTFIKFFYLIFYALTRPRRGRGNNHEARQDRAKAVKHRGEAEAASFLPRGEASASRHTSLNCIIPKSHKEYKTKTLDIF